MVECVACGGRYEPKGADGIEYYHRCPPVLARRVTRNGARVTVPITELQPTDLHRARRGRDIVDLLLADVLEDDTLLDAVYLPRVNARDEQPVNDRDGKRIGIRAEGLGARLVAAEAIDSE